MLELFQYVRNSRFYSIFDKPKSSVRGDFVQKDVTTYPARASGMLAKRPPLLNYSLREKKTRNQEQVVYSPSGRVV